MIESETDDPNADKEIQDSDSVEEKAGVIHEE